MYLALSLLFSFFTLLVEVILLDNVIYIFNFPRYVSFFGRFWLPLVTIFAGYKFGSLAKAKLEKLDVVESQVLLVKSIVFLNWFVVIVTILLFAFIIYFLSLLSY